MAPEMPIGKRIQMYRLRRGLTQEVLAGRVGLSMSWLSQVERGIRSVEKWQTILELSDVLKCDPRDLVGRQLNLAPNGGIPFKALPDLRAVLTGYDSLLTAVDNKNRTGTRAANELDLAGMQRRADDANRQYQAGHYEEAARELVKLVGDAERARWELPGNERQAAFGVLAQAYQAVAKTLTKIHETELSWVATERAASAAERSEDSRLVAATAYHLGHSLRRSGRVQEALTVTERAYQAVMRQWGSDHGDDAVLGLAGGLTLTSVIAAASADDPPAVRELMGRAEYLGDKLRRDGNDYWFAFGPTNVRIHQIWTGVEMGEPREAIRVGEAINADALPSGLVGRRTAVMIDMARAYGQVKMDAAAVNMLIEAERLTAQTVRYSQFVRELVRELLRREHRATTPQLRPFAERLGLLD